MKNLADQVWPKGERSGTEREKIGSSFELIDFLFASFLLYATNDRRQDE